MQRVDVRELIPDRRHAVLERVLEDQRERRDQQGDEVAEREEADAVADERYPSWRLASRSKKPISSSMPSEIASSSTASAVAPFDVAALEVPEDRDRGDLAS